MVFARRLSVVAALAVLALAGAGCGDRPASSRVGPGEPVKVIATTTVLGDLVRQVGGAHADVTQILKPNADAHDYEPRPRDVTAAAGAQVVVASGDGLDRWIGAIVKQSGTTAAVLDVSGKLRVRRPGETAGEEASKYDPHWWHDPRNAMTAVAEIRDALSVANPQARRTYAANAKAYLVELEALDAGLADCFAQVPVARRKLVTDHDAFGYLAGRYDLTLVGAVIPSQTTQAQASAGDVAKLAEVIKREGVKAVFPEHSVNPKLAEALAAQTGANARYMLYGDSLGAAGSTGATYLSMERANADALVAGFTGGTERCAIPRIRASTGRA